MVNWQKNVCFGLALLSVLAFGLLYYAFNIEPFSLKTEVVQLTADGADLQGEPVRIVQFSDTHFKRDFSVGNMEHIAQVINALSADLVVFTGDLYDDYSTYHEDERLIQALSGIQAPYGKLAIWGNRDYGGGASDVYVSILDQSGFTLLQNSNWYIPLENGKTILFTGLDDGLLGHPKRVDETLIYDSDYNIMLVHEPDEFETYASMGYDLAMAGHTHGGQSGLAWFASRSLELKSKYWQGAYEVLDSLLYVNAGIGTTHISARILMPPTLTLYELYL